MYYDLNDPAEQGNYLKVGKSDRSLVRYGRILDLFNLGVCSVTDSVESGFFLSRTASGVEGGARMTQLQEIRSCARYLFPPQPYR